MLSSQDELKSKRAADRFGRNSRKHDREEMDKIIKSMNESILVAMKAAAEEARNTDKVAAA